MTEAEQFLTEFLGVQETDFPITLNLKLYGEALDAYVAHIEKKKSENMNVVATNDSQEAYWRIVRAHNNTAHTPKEVQDIINGTGAYFPTKDMLDSQQNVRILVWDWKYNCYENYTPKN